MALLKMPTAFLQENPWSDCSMSSDFVVNPKKVIKQWLLRYEFLILQKL